MVLPSDSTKVFPSCVQTFLNKNSFLALVSICIRFWVRLSVMLTPVSFNFSLFLNTLFLILYLANLMMIGLDSFPFLSLPIRWLQSISISVRFSCKSSFKVPGTTVLVSSFSLSFTPCNKIQFLRECCSYLSMTVFKSSIWCKKYKKYNTRNFI